MYEEMIKQAYNEILGFEKEAGIAGWSDKKLDRVKRKLEDKTQGGYYDAVSRERKGFGIAGGVVGGLGRTVNASNNYLKNKSKLESVNNEIARRNNSIPQKAAAYYDEAQLAKEAAVSDYNEACAYEEAALAILNELGYLD